MLTSVCCLRSIREQLLNQRDYYNFKKKVNEILEDDKIKETLWALFIDPKGARPSSEGLKIKPLNSDQNPAIENPPKEQIKELIDRKVTRKPKNPGKTVGFLEKFGDPQIRPDNERYDITNLTPQDAIRIKDTEF